MSTVSSSVSDLDDADEGEDDQADNWDPINVHPSGWLFVAV
jgi:hypothetical protein